MCNTCTPRKQKYFVVALVEPLKFFLINSRPTPFQLARPDFMRALAPIYSRSDPFLDHDSYVACNTLLGEYTPEEVEAEFELNDRIFKGDLSPQGCCEVRAALVDNKHLPRKYRPLLHTAWQIEPPESAGDAAPSR